MVWVQDGKIIVITKLDYFPLTKCYETPWPENCLSLGWD